AALHRRRLSRRRREPFESDPRRHQHHLQSLLAQAGGEPVSVGAARHRAHPAIELLKLIGYRRGAYALGYVDDLRDPIEVVRPDLGTTGLGDALTAESARAALKQKQTA